MSLQRWDPFQDMLSLRDAMDRLVQESFVRPSTMGGGQGLGLSLDLSESQDEYTLKASLPGFKPEDVNVTITGDVLSIRAEHKGEEERKDQNYLLRERRFGSVSRTITLPTRVQSDRAQARYENGELILTLPKAEEAKPRQIKIGVQGRQELSGGQQSGHSDQGERNLDSSQPATPEMTGQNPATVQH